MAYLNKITKVKTKPCSCPELPSIVLEDLDVGTTWRCDICQKTWQVVCNVNSFPIEELSWKDISGLRYR